LTTAETGQHYYTASGAAHRLEMSPFRFGKLGVQPSAWYITPAHGLQPLYDAGEIEALRENSCPE
jgi:hypothetical protein